MIELALGQLSYDAVKIIIPHHNSRLLSKTQLSLTVNFVSKIRFTWWLTSKQQQHVVSSRKTQCVWMCDNPVWFKKHWVKTPQIEWFTAFLFIFSYYAYIHKPLIVDRKTGAAVPLYVIETDKGILVEHWLWGWTQVVEQRTHLLFDTRTWYTR